MRSLLGIVLAVLLMQGCNTMEGIGKDIETAGDKLENAAKKSK
ncbi:MAG: entericidin A/B family lipoprotein [Burkholderiales bacterium]|nr:entericidin A/B family lipoprotein [Burkholderiales bacterium]